MNRVAVVCCYNNDSIFESMLLSGLKKQKEVEIEEFFYKDSFPCAAQAYNDAIDKATSDLIVFVHQDIRFDDDMFLDNLYETVRKDKSAIYGLCGAISTKNGTVTYSNVYHGLQNRNIGEQVTEPIQVEGLDEIFVAMHIDIAKKLRFDERIVDGWHMFVENLCLDAREHHLGVFVFPGHATHKNEIEMPGYMMAYKLFPKDFFKYLKIVRNKHRNTSKAIICPCITIKTDAIHFYPMYFMLKYKTSIKRWLRTLSMK